MMIMKYWAARQLPCFDSGWQKKERQLSSFQSVEQRTCVFSVCDPSLVSNNRTKIKFSICDKNDVQSYKMVQVHAKEKEREKGINTGCKTTDGKREIQKMLEQTRFDNPLCGHH